jgi:energy-coupling factor transport system ATP-binding protein
LKLQAQTKEIEKKEDTDVVVSFENVDFIHRNGVAALKSISLTIHRGELVAILGTNGAGKSTLVRHINGLLKPNHGKVQVFGIDTTNTTPASLSRKVGVVFQNPNNQLFGESVKSEIQFGLKNFGFSDQVIEERTTWVLSSFSLDVYSDKAPMELSGGEKKRLCIGLVLAWDPEILILDEPTVGQDFDQKERLIQTIKTLQSQGKTVILVTHDVEFVWPLQPRVILMAEGRIIADGSSQSALGDKKITERANVLPPQLVEIFNLLDSIQRFPANILEAKNMLTSTKFRREAT